VHSQETIQAIKEKLSSVLSSTSHEAAIILAAGHGKRIKSHRSKMLHEIWGVTTVERVYRACTAALSGVNSVIVVGIKAHDVMNVIGKRENTAFAFQAEQKGTGHAVQIGLAEIPKDFNGIVYVFPGDMGLIDQATIKAFRDSFLAQKTDMMVLTGIYEGAPELNSYGRIIRVKETDRKGKSSGNDNNNVIEIIEHKDILALPENEPYITSYKGREYAFTKQELIETREYNSGVYAFDSKKLFELVYSITSQNAQQEIYITDLIGLFNKQGYVVGASSPKEEYVVMGFNDKAVLKEMDTIFRKKIYESLKNIIEIDDPDDFFINECVAQQIIELDAKGGPLDIRIGKGVYIGADVQLNYNLTLKKNAFVSGNIQFGKNVTIGDNVHMSCFPHQKMIIGENVEILWGDILKGNIIIGDNCRIESSVNMTGSDEYPLRLGKNVLVKGTSYLFGTVVEDDIHIEHSVLIHKKVNRLVKRDGSIQRIRFYLPMPSGVDAVESCEQVIPEK
jgi:bifunctional UDP-N-acetylglucosamine pyrophosphorylase/glucosamine-1-phosphate N-acetyltransferase